MEFKTAYSLLGQLEMTIEQRKQAVERHNSLQDQLNQLRTKVNRASSVQLSTKTATDFIIQLRTLEKKSKVVELGLTHEDAIFGKHSLSNHNTYKVHGRGKVFTVQVIYSDSDLIEAVDVYALGPDARTTNMNDVYEDLIANAKESNSLAMLMLTLRKA